MHGHKGGDEEEGNDEDNDYDDYKLFNDRYTLTKPGSAQHFYIKGKYNNG